MAGFLDFLTEFFKKEDKKDTSIVVKNYINGNNSQNNQNTSHPPKTANSKNLHSGKGLHQSDIIKSQISLQSIRLYSTGARGKVYTDRFYKSINHNFGIEVVLMNHTAQTRTVTLGHCIYDERGATIIKGNFHPKIAPHSTLRQDIYVKPETFSKLKNGKYKSQFWLNSTKVQKVFFTIAKK